MSGNRTKPTDVNGKRLKVGDRVRILGVPDLSWMAAKQRDESSKVFKHLVGLEKRILGFDELGNAELVFQIRKGNSRGLHVVGIETALLRRRRA